MTDMAHRALWLIQCRHVICALSMWPPFLGEGGAHPYIWHILYANIFRYCLLWNCMIIKVGNACQLPQDSRGNRFWRQRLWRQESGKLHNNHMLELNVRLVSACWYIVTCKWVTLFLSYSPIVFFPSYMICVKPLFCSYSDFTGPGLVHLPSLISSFSERVSVLR